MLSRVNVRSLLYILMLQTLLAWESSATADFWRKPDVRLADGLTLIFAGGKAAERQRKRASPGSAGSGASGSLAEGQRNTLEAAEKPDGGRFAVCPLAKEQRNESRRKSGCANAAEACSAVHLGGISAE